MNNLQEGSIEVKENPHVMDKLLKRIKLVNKYENINNAKRLDSPKQVSIEEEKKRKNASATIHMFKQVHD